MWTPKPLPPGRSERAAHAQRRERPTLFGGCACGLSTLQLHTWFDGLRTLRLLNALRTLRLLNALRARWPDVDAETAAAGPF
jgi:hypothetical protein